MGTIIDISGGEFGSLSVLRRDGVNKHDCAMWICRCNCGNEIRARGDYLRQGRTQSCGCKLRGDQFGIAHGMKRCKDCGTVKPISDFPSGAGRRCKPCKAAKFYSPDKRLERSAASYGITIEQWRDMMARQEGRCSICGDPFADRRDTHIDHDHASGKVRALLCGLCNVGLGAFSDSPERLRLAAAYVERHAN